MPSCLLYRIVAVHLASKLWSDCQGGWARVFSTAKSTARPVGPSGRRLEQAVL